LVIPTHYRTQAAEPANCEIKPVDDFLNLMPGVNVKRSNSNTVAINSKMLSENTEIEILSYKF
jgi:hypothetical protein